VHFVTEYGVAFYLKNLRQRETGFIDIAHPMTEMMKYC
jgi:hypothetical protein